MKDKIKGLMIGITLALITIIIALFFPVKEEIEFLAVILSAIMAVYLGFVFSNGNNKDIAIEVTNAVFYALLIFAGLWMNPLFLAIGYFWHGIWDAIHCKGLQIIKTRVPNWYIYLCMAYDWIIGAFILVSLI